MFTVVINYCMMELSSMDNSELMDLLAKYTSDYTRMMSEGTSHEEYEKCNMTIKALQAEIESRKGNQSTNITPPPDFIV